MKQFAGIIVVIGLALGAIVASGHSVLNLAEVGPALWLQLRNEACALPALTTATWSLP